MARIVKVLATITACAFCVGMIVSTKLESQMGVYVCIGGCLVSFLINMFATAQANKKIVEENLKKENE